MGFLDKLLGRRRQPSSREIAKERLQLVLVHDRLRISPGLLQTLKDELIAVISKHIEIDQDGVEITFTHDKRYSRLVADIPVVKVRGRSGN
jgi:cell division topological specificity factor